MFELLILLGFGLTVGGISLLFEDDNAQPVETTGGPVEPAEDASGASEASALILIAAAGEDPLFLFSADTNADFQTLSAAAVAAGELDQEELDEINSVLIVAPDSDANVTGTAQDDFAISGSGNDTISTGAGEDIAVGGPGDDLILLGDGADVSGEYDVSFTQVGSMFSTSNDLPFGSQAQLESGNDTIRGGAGDDEISDSFGSNELRGENGDDVILAVDADGLTPDLVRGGMGSDTLVVDQGDTVNTGADFDFVRVDLTSGVAAGFQPITIQEFDVIDDLELRSDETTLGVNGANVSVEPFDGGTTVLVNNIPVVRVISAFDLPLSNILFEIT